MRYLVTGTAGFIGYHVAKRLLDEGHEVVGVDGFTAFYDSKLKERRNALLAARNGYVLHRAMLEDLAALERIAADGPIDVIIHLAAQAGVRYSLEQPRSYIDSNLVGTFNVMEIARRLAVKHFMLASTSSVYGGNSDMPFAEIHKAAHPLTLYAATKAATEAMTHAYAHLWAIPTTAFRFFTVYGPWGRPDMAMFKFTKGVLEGTPIDIYNNGDMVRDFTFIDDLVEGIYRLSHVVPPTVAGRGATPAFDSLSPVAPFRAVNIGGGTPVPLLRFIEAVETAAGRKAVRNYLPMQKGDVLATDASTALLEHLTGYKPTTSVETGVARFVAWYRDSYSVNTAT
jgi:UDP-glucuronate 4-epimerase